MADNREENTQVSVETATDGKGAARHNFTPEEKKAYAEKKQAELEQVSKQLEEGVKQFFNSDSYKEYLAVMGKFRHYSFNNTMLIAMQFPEARLVAGYNDWKNKFHRYVRKGEKGIRVIAPVTTTKEVMADKMDPSTGKLVRDAEGNPVKEKKTVTFHNFKMTSVFDVSQTEGEPLPALGTHQISGTVEDYDRFMKAIRELSPVPITFGSIPGDDVNGYFDPENHKIVVKEDMSEMQTMKTLIHEVAHALLHSREQMAKDGVQKDRETKEVEAESVAYTVCRMFGLDTSAYSFPYIASWSSGKDMKELKASMDTIRRTAGTMIESIDAALEGHERAQRQQPEPEPELFGEDDPFMKPDLGISDRSNPFLKPEDYPLPFADAGEDVPSCGDQEKGSVLGELHSAMAEVSDGQTQSQHEQSHSRKKQTPHRKGDAQCL